MKQEQEGGFLGMLLDTLADNVLRNILAVKRVTREGEGLIWAGGEMIRKGQYI